MMRILLFLIAFVSAIFASIPPQTNTPYAQVITESKENGTEIHYTCGNDLVSNGSHYVLTDALGSTRGLVDSSESLTDSYDYHPYGELSSHSGTSENSFLFTGEQFDQESGNYYLRARYYSSSLARFLSRDTYDGKASDPLSQNHYLYAGGNPVMYVDPSGKFSMSSLSMSMAISGMLNAGIGAGITVSSGGHVTIGSVVTDFAIGMLEGGIFIGAQSNIIKLFDRFKSITKISGLTRAHAKNIDKINEIFHNVTVRQSLSGNLLDPGHIEKLQNHRRGLIRAVNGLKGSLNNPNLTWRVRRLIKKKIALGEGMIRRINELPGD